MTNIYLDGEYYKKHPGYHVGTSPWKAKQVLKMIDRHHLQPGSVCEVGCGAGEILCQLQMKLKGETQFFGYEISPQAYSLCQSRENERLHFFHQDILEIQMDSPYDLLLCLDVFEHVEDYLGFLRKLRHKGADKMFHIPLDMSAQILVRGSRLLYLREEFGHLHYFDKDTALSTLHDAGYEVIDWFYTPAVVDTGKSFKSRLAKLPRILTAKINQDFAARVLGGFSLLVYAR